MSRMKITERLEALAREQEELRLELEYLNQQLSSPWPREFTIYVQAGSLFEDSAFIEFAQDAGWEDGSSEYDSLSRCAYEHEMTYMVDKDGTTMLVSVDGRKLLPKEG